jgi:hypothetical protein
MTRTPAQALVAALLLLAACAGRTPADPIPFQYESQAFAPGNSTGSQLIFTPSQAGDGTASIAGNGWINGAGSSVITAANLYFSATAGLGGNGSAGPGDSVFDPQPFVLKLSLKDTASGASGSLLFPGTFSGTVGLGGATGTLGFAPPTNGSGWSQVLGGNRYTVDPSQPPSWQGLDSGMLGATQFSYYPIQFHIDVQPGGIGSGPGAPEPSGLALAAVGLGTLGAAAWRRWRGRRVP